MSHHGTTGLGLLMLVSALAVPLVAYLLAVSETNGAWPVRRSACWVGGLVALAAGLGAGPVTGSPGFVAHTGSHLLIGMVAPLLLALGAPVPLALRALPVGRARALVRVLRSRPVRTLGHPATAAVLNVGGLWLLYATPLYGPVHDHPLLHVHVLAAGYLFAAAILGAHPRPAAFGVRAAVLVAALAAHGVLAKYVYAHPPVGVPAADAEVGGVLMYYGGDVVDLVLIVLLCRAWFRTLGRGTAPARPVPAQSPS